MGEHYPHLRVEDLDDRLVVTLDRPEVRNAIDTAMVESLHRICAGLEHTPRPLILTGGPDIFAAGADIAQLRTRGPSDALAGINSALFHRIAALPMPTVAAVAGPAIGGGAELAYACDFRIGTDRTRFGNPEGQLGILAAAGAAWRLPELVGEQLAKEILLTGRTLNAAEALDVRLLNEVVDADALIATAHAWVDRMLRNAPLALQLAKTALRAPREAHPVLDNVVQAVLFETDEKARRMDAFLSRRRA
ncbi:enoyl-CoA hydratase/isomerase family protein [Streptomyces hyderabadensis]|uniref:Enoyl-CoA hydratase/isomerase family protein n=1 Tax=Streptomyces hyderabadensis TaxID=598549 RepID=A0ABP9IQ41_9ACTN|nr:enoyl-CoA hydratase/isomerase family protein [Streptomyces hyderabadensis]